MRHLPPFPALRAFETAARLGSFAATGTELHQTPSAISHQIRALEAWFDRPLFLRAVRRVTLTADGQRLLGELSTAFDLIEDACTTRRPTAKRSGWSVHCSPSFASKWLGPRLSRFYQAYPAITIRLTSSAEPVDLKSQPEVDIDIAYGSPPARAGMVVESLGDEPTLPLAAPGLFNGAVPGGPRDLARFTLIDSKLNPVQWADWYKLNTPLRPHRLQIVPHQRQPTHRRQVVFQLLGFNSAQPRIFTNTPLSRHRRSPRRWRFIEVGSRIQVDGIEWCPAVQQWGQGGSGRTPVPGRMARRASWCLAAVA